MRIHLVLLAVLFTSGVALAGPIAVLPVGGGLGVIGGANVGFQFSTSSTLLLDGLGYFDEKSDGLTESHQVGIFDSATGNLLVSSFVPLGTAGTLVSGFRVTPISFTLDPGTYVIAAQAHTNSDRSRLQTTSITTVAGVTYLQDRMSFTSSFVMPTTNQAGNETGFFGPNFTVAVDSPSVPEPEPLVLFVSGAALCLVALRRQRSAKSPK